MTRSAPKEGWQVWRIDGQITGNSADQLGTAISSRSLRLLRLRARHVRLEDTGFGFGAPVTGMS